MPATAKYRVMISCLLMVSLSGFSLGAKGAAAVSARRAEHAPPFQYEALSRVEFPLLMGTYLKAGLFAPFIEAAQPAFPIPALGEGYIPQGMCHSQALGCFVLAYYYPGHKRPSLIALVDSESGVHVKSLYLLGSGGIPYTGHAGGAAAWGEHIWITSGGRAWRLAAEDIRQAADRSTVRFRDNFKVASRGSFAFTDGDTLWAGDYHKPEDTSGNFARQLDPGSGNMAWCAGYKLSADAPMGVAGLTRSGETPAPAAMLSLPDCVQGAATATTGELMLSCSFTSKLPSYLWVYPSLRGMLSQAPAYEVEAAGGNVPLWVVSEGMVLRTQMIAPMSEGAASAHGKIYVVYESAALEYRERALLFADYVFSMEESLLLAAP